MNIINKIVLIILGILVSLVILEIGLQTAGFTLTTLQNIKNKKSKDPNIITVLCLGESTTANQWPPILQKILDTESKDKKFNIIDLGRPCFTTDFFVKHIYEYMQKYNPDIVISMIGVNDNGLGYKKHPFKTVNLIQLIYEHLKIKYIIFDHTSQSYNKFDSYALDLWLNNKYEEAERIYLKLFEKSHHTNSHLYVRLLQLNNVFNKRDKFLDLITNYNIKMYAANLQEVEKYFIEYKNDRLQLIQWIRKNKHKLEYSDATVFLLKKYNCDDVIEDIKSNTFPCDNFIKHETYDNEQTKEQTKENYLYIINTIFKRHLTTIVMPMQYPVLSVETLKERLKSSKHYDKLIFISNEENFKGALANNKPEKIFKDMFAISFGHCTDYGNKLIAENVAESILKQVQ